MTDSLRHAPFNGETHELKTWPDSFGAVVAKLKRAEYRLDDRVPAFRPGDRLQLREWDPKARCYTGREVIARVLHVARGPHIPEGFAMLSIEVLG